MCVCALGLRNLTELALVAVVSLRADTARSVIHHSAVGLAFTETCKKTVTFACKQLSLYYQNKIMCKKVSYHVLK